MTRYRLTDGAIGTMIPDDQVSAHWGACNPDKEGDLWLQVEGEKSPRCVSPSAAVFVPPLPAHASQVPLTLDQMAQQLRDKGYAVRSPSDTLERARSLMAGLEDASGVTMCSALEWRNGVKNEQSVKAYNYLLEWARTVC